MLYCPKCQATYKDGTQRFCTNEGARLLPSPSSEPSGQQAKGVFSSILGKSLIKPENRKSETVVSGFQPPVKSKFFRSEEEDESVEESKPKVAEINKQEAETKTKSFEHIPLANIINPSLIQEKQRDMDKVFTGETEKTKKPEELNPEFSGQADSEKKEIPEQFVKSNQDFLEVDEQEDLILSENFDKIELTDDNEIELSESPTSQDEFELNIATQDANALDSDSELELNLVENDEIPKITESEPSFNLDLDELLETFETFKPDSHIELEVNDLEENSIVSEPPPKIELDLVDLEDVAIPSKVELDLESKKEINLADSIPRIELDLADLDDVSTPEKVENEPDLEQESVEIPVATESKTFPPRIIKDEISNILQSSLPLVNSNIEEKTEFKEKNDSEKLVAKESDKKEEEIAADTTNKSKINDDPTWEKRSSEASGNEESKWFLYPLIGLIVLGLGLLGFFYLTNQNSSPTQGPANKQTENSNQSNANANDLIINSNSDVNANDLINNNSNVNGSTSEQTYSSSNPDDSGFQSDPKSDLSAVPPLPRNINQPPNTVLYKNDKKQLKGALAEKFLGFSIYYPKDWTETKSDNKFLDIAKKNPQGLPIKQLLITRYDSKGTFDSDRAIFEELVDKSNTDLRGILSNYEVISEGETIFQNGRWRVYEVKFQGIGSDKKLIIWGRRLWIPVQRPEMKSGFIITMIGTSLSNDVKSVEDLGEKDDLAEILKTFEPELR
jgi:hypothetical protein